MSTNSCSQSQSPPAFLHSIGSCTFSEHAAGYTANLSALATILGDCHDQLSDPALGSGRCPGTGWVFGRTTTKMTTTTPNPLAPTQATPSHHRLRGSTCSTGEIPNVHGQQLPKGGGWMIGRASGGFQGGCLGMFLGVCKKHCLNEYLFGRLSVDVGVGEGRGCWWGCVCEFVLLRGENYFIPIEESEPLLNHLSPTMAEMPEAVVETWRPTLEDSKVLPAWQAFPLMRWSLNLTSR